MKHSVEVNNDDTVEIRVVGKISGHEVNDLLKQVKSFVNQLEKSGKKLKVLASYTHAGKHNTHSHNLVSNLFDGLNFHKMATYNLDTLPTRMIVEAVKQNGLQDKVRTFRTRDEATGWLGL